MTALLTTTSVITGWPRSRAARSVDSLARYRAVIGVGLAFHFARHAMETTPWLAASRGAGVAPEPLQIAWFGHAVPAYGVVMLFVLSSALGVLTALGRYPRALALILSLVSVAVYSAILPLATLDDYFANLAALTVAMLPSCALSQSSAKVRPKDHELRTTSVAILLAFVLVLYVSGGPGALSSTEVDLATWVPTAFRLLAVVLVVPVERVRRFGVFLQVCLHGYLLATTSLVLTHVGLAATALLFCGDLPKLESASFRFDFASVTALACALVAFAGYAGSYVFQADSREHARILTSLGLIPLHVTLPAAAADSVHLQVNGPRGSRREALDRDTNRKRVAASRLAAIDPREPLARTLASAVLRQYCGERGHAGDIGKLLQGISDERRIAEFTCGENGTLTVYR